ncbi:MAG: UDP-galactopyranose mutase [Candidatus Kapaibacteriota bacterium]|jgi:UDP-galactopyranose mutase
MKFDYLIVGSGLSGAVLAERIANELNKKVLIIDKRNHIGGNVYDYYNEYGILVHKYGPHIFHTQMKKVWDYTSQFTDWNLYYHKVLAVVDGQKIPVPFNLNSLHKVFPANYAKKLEDLLISNYGFGIKVPILKLLETKNDDLKFLADYVYKNIFLGYNLKQWGLKPEELDYSVSSRVPIYISRDDRYFQDTYQGIPKEGYTKIIEKMLSNKNIKVLLNTDYKEVIGDIKFDKLIYTGHIDYYFDNMFGHLPYRTLEFKLETIFNEAIDSAFFQEKAQINYPNDYDFTRITEFKHLTSQKSNHSTIAYEFPKAYDHNQKDIDPYYPIPKEENTLLFNKYKAEADKLENVIFLGRLADYKYYNMDQTIGVALQTFEKKIVGR